MQASNVNDSSSGSTIEVSLGYLPTLAYCNMFTLFYLETIQQMKVITLKKKKDQTLGYRINNLIFAFYMILFGALLIAQIAGEAVSNEKVKEIPECLEC